MLRVKQIAHTKSTIVVQSRACVYGVKPILKSERKPGFEAIVIDKPSIEAIRRHRLAKEWHIFKRRSERRLLEAYDKALKEAEEQKHEEKKQKRKQRREDTAEERQSRHFARKRKEALHKHLMDTRPWEKNIMEEKVTIDFPSLLNPLAAPMDDEVPVDILNSFRPETLLPVESWLFFHPNSWKDIPHLSNVFNAPRNSFDWVIQNNLEELGEFDNPDKKILNPDAFKTEGKSDSIVKATMEPRSAKLTLEHRHSTQPNRFPDNKVVNDTWLPDSEPENESQTQTATKTDETSFDFDIFNDNDAKLNKKTDKNKEFKSFEEENPPKPYEDDVFVPMYDDPASPSMAKALEYLDPQPILEHKTDVIDFSYFDDSIKKKSFTDLYEEPEIKKPDFFVSPFLKDHQIQPAVSAAELLSKFPEEREIFEKLMYYHPDRKKFIIERAERSGLNLTDLTELKKFLETHTPSAEELGKFMSFVVFRSDIKQMLLDAIRVERVTDTSEEIVPSGTSKYERAFTNEAEYLGFPLENQPEPEPDGDGMFSHDELPESDENIAKRDDDDFDEEEDEGLEDVEELELSKYFIDYAFKLKNHLDEQMNDQLAAFGLLSGSLTDAFLMQMDPPRLGIDIDPCVEITQSSHYQSITGYDSLRHRERKITIKIRMKYLHLPQVVKQRFIAMVGSRYDKRTDTFKFVADAQHNKHQNTVFGIHQIRKILEAAFQAHSNYIPLSDLNADPTATAIDCPVELKRIPHYELPYLRPKPYVIDQRKLKPLPSYLLYRVAPFGWTSIGNPIKRKNKESN